MIDQRTVTRIEQLLDQDMAQCKVALLCRVGKSTVNQIHHGTRRGRYIDKAAGESPTIKRVPIITDGPIGRCRHCGRVVQFPCLDCLRDLQKQHDRVEGAA